MTAFLRPKKPPFIRAEPGSHGDQWLMSEADLEDYARADRAQQLELPPDLSLEQLDEKLAAWLHLNLHGYVDAKAVSSDAQRAPLTEWQPIETAPKDGTRILLAIEHVDRAILGFFEHGVWTTIDGHNWNGHTVTHWMPLPPPPAERAHGIEGGETHNARLSGRQQP